MAQTSVRQRGSRIWKRFVSPRWDALRAAALLSGLIVVFLWTPLTRSGVYAPVDDLQSYALFRITPDTYIPQNPLMSDTVRDALPWLHANSEAIHAGHLPLWNPDNSAGVPSLANIQMGLFSPFSLPFYVFDLRFALILSSFAKLFITGMFMYLFLRRVGLGFGPAIIGACAWTFAAPHLLEITWPTTATAPMLPAAMFFVADASAIPVARTGRRMLALLGLAFSLTLGLFGGHPETFFFCTLLIGAYALAKSVTARRPERLRRLLEYAGAAVGGCTLAAIQLLPFLEYLTHSAMFLQRDTTDAKGLYRIGSIPLSAFPYLFGSPKPLDRYYYPGFENFVVRNVSYTGLVTLVLAGIAVGALVNRRSRTVIGFASVALVCAVLVYDVGHVSALIAHLPIIRTMLLYRTGELWLFSIATLAAYGVNALSFPIVRRARAAYGIAAWGIGITGVMIAGAFVLLHTATPTIRAADPAFNPWKAIPHIVAISAITLMILALILLTLREVRRPAIIHSVLRITCVLAIFAQTGLLFRSFTPTVDRRYVYPSSATFAALTQRTGNGLTFGLDDATIPEDANLWYHMQHIGNYDVLGIRSYEELLGAFLPHQSRRSVSSLIAADTRALQLFGVQYVATYRPVPLPIDASPVIADTTHLSALGIAPHYALTQTFTVSQPGFAALGISFGTFGRVNTCSLTLALDDVTAARAITQMTQRCADIQQGKDVQLIFAPQPDSRTHLYRLSITSPDAGTDNAVAAFTTPAVGEGELDYGQAAVPQRLLLTPLATPLLGVTRVWSDNGVNLFAVPNSLPRYYTVSQATAVPDDTTALAMLDDAGFDPTQSVLLAASPTPAKGTPGEGNGRVEVVEETPTRIRLHTERDAPGWLVALQSYYPGWHATVNGQATPIKRANVAFRAVPVPAGSSDIVFEYQPASVRIGAIISGTALLGSIALAIVSFERVRRRRRRERWQAI